MRVEHSNFASSRAYVPTHSSLSTFILTATPKYKIDGHFRPTLLVPEMYPKMRYLTISIILSVEVVMASTLQNSSPSYKEIRSTTQQCLVSSPTVLQ